jgi:hypothetical protein
MRVDGSECYVNKRDQPATFTPSLSWAAPTCHRDELPVARQANRAERINNRAAGAAQIRFWSEREALSLRSKLARSCSLRCRRGACPVDRYVPNALLGRPTNSGDSGVNPNPTSELKACLSRDGCPVARDTATTFFSACSLHPTPTGADGR